MTSCFNIQSATADWVKRVKETMCLIPLLLKQLYVLLGEGLKNCRIIFLKILRLFELRIHISRLFHSIITDGKKEFLRKMFKVKTG